MSKRILKKKVESDDEEDDDIDDIDENKDNDDDEIEDDDDDDDDENGYSLEEEENENLECIIEKAIEENYTNDSDIEEEIQEEIVSNNDRISANRLTKYEMVRIIGERIKQLNMGAKPLIKNYESLNYENIAIQELKLNMIPYKIKRPLPNGKFEIWTLDELSKDHLLLELDD
jgi:DNA-directed RNA polymerase subunit K/omega